MSDCRDGCESYEAGRCGFALSFRCPANHRMGERGHSVDHEYLESHFEFA